MGKYHSRLGLIISLIYILLVVGALSFAYFVITRTPGKSEFVGIYIVILTLPWSIFSTILLDFLRIQDAVSLSTKFWISIGEAIINVLVLYFVGKKIEDHRQKSN